ncbi:hypothetical protein AVEN_186728-1 [Araneus ventricosus]|uniref:Uncharacterized protein n=1 Tax=Araneus ventricosus TaxID=182803 RepID=A0A4Y2SSC9_ARAVE|nr:hypothetical protein AVEN_186728-1 [Araneus ventricosus]
MDYLQISILRIIVLGRLQFNGIIVHKRSNSSKEGWLPPINVIPNHDTTRSARKLMSREFGKLPIPRGCLPKSELIRDFKSELITQLSVGASGV